MGKQHANKGLKRNKKPLPNLMYKFELKQVEDLREGTDPVLYEHAAFKDEGYILAYWKYEGMPTNVWHWHGFTLPSTVKEWIGEKQWSKFCQGKREFIVQRREDGKNL